MANVTGGKALREKLRKMPELAQKSIRKAIKISANQVRTAARQRVPVETAHLKKAIKVYQDDDGMGARVGVVKDDAFYAFYVEFGTSKTAPRPFLIPAHRAERPKIRRRYRNAVRKALKMQEANGD